MLTLPQHVKAQGKLCVLPEATSTIDTFERLKILASRTRKFVNCILAKGIVNSG